MLWQEAWPILLGGSMPPEGLRPMVAAENIDPRVLGCSPGIVGITTK